MDKYGFPTLEEHERWVSQSALLAQQALFISSRERKALDELLRNINERGGRKQISLIEV
jgi:hypothetical protein